MTSLTAAGAGDGPLVGVAAGLMLGTELAAGEGVAETAAFGVRLVAMGPPPQAATTSAANRTDIVPMLRVEDVISTRLSTVRT